MGSLTPVVANGDGTDDRITLNTNSNPHQVTVTIPASNAQADRLFSRVVSKQK